MDRGQASSQSARVAEQKRGLLAMVIAVLVVFLLAWLLGGRQRDQAGGSKIGGSRGAVTEEDRSLEAERRKAWAKVVPRMDAADAAVAAQIEPCVAAIDRFFSERRGGIRPFAEEIFSLRGKWEYIHSRLPMGTEEEYVASLLKKFEENVFTAEEFRSSIEESVAGYLISVRDTERQLLVQVRKDVGEVPPEVLPALRSERILEEEYDRLFRRLANDVGQSIQGDLLGDVGKLVVSQIVRKLISQVLKRLGISTGVLSIGAAFSWSNLGVSLVAAVVLDIAIDWLLKLAGHDPAGDVAEKVSGTLDRIRHRMIEGDADIMTDYEALRRQQSDHPHGKVREAAGKAADAIKRAGLPRGLRMELSIFNEERSRLRRDVLRRLTLEGEGR